MADNSERIDQGFQENQKPAGGGWTLAPPPDYQPGSARQQMPSDPGPVPAEHPQSPRPQSSAYDVELFSRFLVGLALVGSDQVLQRIQEVGRDLEAYPTFLQPETPLDKASALELLRYLGIGLFAKGQRQVSKGVRTGFYASLGTTSWILDKLDRATDNWLARPVRRPVESRLRKWGRGVGQVMREGRLEDQRSRRLAQEATYAIVDDVVEFIAENPEVTGWIQEVVAQQGVGLAQVVRDNARQLSAASDDFAEGLLRRILRRTPRRDLPSSALAGKPQTMYSPETAPEVVGSHDEATSA